MTDEEARTKWCPMVRCAEFDESSANCGPTAEFRNPPWARCIGSECCVWAHTARPTANNEIIIVKGTGHCGLIK